MEIAIASLATVLVVGAIAGVYALRSIVAMTRDHSDKLLVLVEKQFLEKLIQARNNPTRDFPPEGYRDVARTPTEQWTKAPSDLFSDNSGGT